jgi:hypothetical protein
MIAVAPTTEIKSRLKEVKEIEITIDGDVVAEGNNVPVDRAVNSQLIHKALNQAQRNNFDHELYAGESLVLTRQKGYSELDLFAEKHANHSWCLARNDARPG